jgi:hypothetical protein
VAGIRQALSAAHAAAVNVLGDHWTYHPAGGGAAIPLRGIFSRASVELDAGGGGQVDVFSVDPQLAVRVTDLPLGDAHGRREPEPWDDQTSSGDEVEALDDLPELDIAAGDRWRVYHFEENGRGLLRLTLRKGGGV